VLGPPGAGKSTLLHSVRWLSCVRPTEETGNGNVVAHVVAGDGLALVGYDPASGPEV
jgi:hypothetical protein